MQRIKIKLLELGEGKNIYWYKLTWRTEKPIPHDGEIGQKNSRIDSERKRKGGMVSIEKTKLGVKERTGD